MSDGSIIHGVDNLFRDFAEPDGIDPHIPYHMVRGILESRRRVGREAALADLIRARAETKRDIENARIEAEREAKRLADYTERLAAVERRTRM
jgi:hypothetical protein